MPSLLHSWSEASCDQSKGADWFSFCFGTIACDKRGMRANGLFSLQWPWTSGIQLHSSECVPFTLWFPSSSPSFSLCLSLSLSPSLSLLYCIASAAPCRDAFRKTVASGKMSYETSCFQETHLKCSSCILQLYLGVVLDILARKSPLPHPPLSHEVNWRKYGNGEGIGVMLLSKGWGRCDFEIWSGLMGVDWILPPFSFTASFHSHTDRAAVLF